MKRLLAWALCVGMLTAVLVIGLSQAGSEQPDPPPAKPFDLQAALAKLEGAPPELASLHAQSSELLDGGLKAFNARMRALEGTPIVINKWASWCHPCLAEFPIFQQVATERGRSVAFVGINGSDSTDPARKFLAEHPVPYPSYVDPDEEIAQAIKAAKNYPITVFVNPTGEVTIKQGTYREAAALDADIDRYAAA
ncbi:MAG TPA: TlpA disulfide reductase family protein [Solirubrobacteraceae bacterium]|nr:TlpA disulfide reductase family protein [Solirubrobacteraceae bacterium]